MDINNKTEVLDTEHSILKEISANLLMVKILIIKGDNEKSLDIINQVMKVLQVPDLIDYKNAGFGGGSKNE